MRVLRHVELAVDKHDTLGAIVRRVHGALPDLAIPARVYLSTMGGRGGSICTRIVETAPSLRPCAQGRPVTVVSSFDEKVGAGVPVCTPDRAELAAIADGVPSRFPLEQAGFYYGPVPALQLTADLGPARRDRGGAFDVGAAEIAVVAAHVGNGRQIFVRAGVIADPPPPDATRLPPLPAAAQALLDSLGTVQRQSQVILAVGDEQAQLRAAAPVIDAALQALPALDPSIYPHALADDPPEGQAFGSVKTVLGAALRPLGYRYQAKATRRGIWVFTRRTAARNELAITIDRGPMYGSLEAMLALAGPLWCHDLRIPLAPGCTKLRTWTEATTRRLADNLAAAVAALEPHLLAAVEPHRPPGAAWFSRVAF
jgi:hypothetical protein